jgi:hypothetical protein
MGGDELRRQERRALGDLLGAAREVGHQVLLHAGDLVAGALGVAAAARLEAVAEGLGEKVAEHALVELGEGRHRLEKGAAVERPPAPVGDRARPVPDHRVGVQLRVVGARRPVREGGGDDAADVLLDDAGLARAGAEDVLLRPGEHDLDGPPVAVVDDGLGLLVGERPGDAWSARTGMRRGRGTGPST